jgi:hypothetical protein
VSGLTNFSISPMGKEDGEGNIFDIQQIGSDLPAFLGSRCKDFFDGGLFSSRTDRTRAIGSSRSPGSAAAEDYAVSDL